MITISTYPREKIIPVIKEYGLSYRSSDTISFLEIVQMLPPTIKNNFLLGRIKYDNYKVLFSIWFKYHCAGLDRFGVEVFGRNNLELAKKFCQSLEPLFPGTEFYITVESEDEHIHDGYAASKDNL